MENERKDIKWIEEYPALKQVNPVNAFTVPSNYFEEMEKEVMSHIRIQTLTNSVNAGFTIPANYFDELTQNIESRVVIQQVLTNDNVFTVPENYFEDLSQNIQTRAAIEEALNTETSFTIPENYFEGLTQNIQARVAIEEALNNEKAFSVPENYFEDLEQNIHAKIAIEKVLNTETAFTVPDGYFAALENKILEQTTLAPAKQADKNRQGVIVKLLVSKAFKYASAACFTLVVGGAVFMSEFNNPVATHNRSYLHKGMSQIPSDELESYLELNNDSPAILSNVDPDNLDTQTANANTEVKNN